MELPARTLGYVYGLVDPRDHTLRYVGKTINLKNRLEGHIGERNVTDKCLWIHKLLRVGMEPQMVVLGTYPVDDLDVEEAAMIAGVRAVGATLYNIADGGRSCSRPRLRRRIARAPARPRQERPVHTAPTEQQHLDHLRWMSLITPPYKKYRPNHDDPNRSAGRIDRWFARKGTTFLDYQVRKGEMTEEDAEEWREIHRRTAEGLTVRPVWMQNT